MPALLRLSFLSLATATILFPGCAPVPSGSDSGAAESIPTPPVAEVGSFFRINDTARFLAGMPGGGNAKLKSLRGTSGWQSHVSRMDQLFGYFDRGHLPKIRPFRAELGDLTSPGVLFYPFSGPDYLFANGFFPGARNIVMVGLEGVEPIPDLGTLSDGEILMGLNGISRSLKDLTGASYFVTKTMRVDLASTRFRGTLPPLLVMIARSGQSIQSVTPIGLSSGGSVTSRSAGAGCPGWHIVAAGKHIYYFQEDLSNGSLDRDKRLLSFVRSKGAPVTFVKSASYLMHTGGFSTIRNFIISDSHAVLQDASGVPYAHLNSSGMSLTLYGNYTRPLDVFDNHYQADLAAAYRTGSPNPVKPIDFGVGYLRTADNPCLILARR